VSDVLEGATQLLDGYVLLRHCVVGRAVGKEENFDSGVKKQTSFHHYNFSGYYTIPILCCIHQIFYIQKKKAEIICTILINFTPKLANCAS
jgi:hypothetical protein